MATTVDARCESVASTSLQFDPIEVDSGPVVVESDPSDQSRPRALLTDEETKSARVKIAQHLLAVSRALRRRSSDGMSVGRHSGESGHDECVHEDRTETHDVVDVVSVQVS